jgi:pimeloyl-ACP methyl ester carboxylesterase
MFANGKCFGELSEILKKDYCVIVPNLDGHGTDDTVFHSVQEEADKIIDYLKQNNITNLELLLGTSLGGIIAFEVFRRGQIVVKHLFLDGAPFIQFPGIMRKIMGVAFKKVAYSAKNNSNNNIILDKKFPKFASQMKDVCSHMRDESIRNLPDACYTYKLPEYIELNGNTVTFMYGTKEKARMSIPKIKKYTNAELITKDGFSHCQFLSDDPQGYVELLYKIMK